MENTEDITKIPTPALSRCRSSVASSTRIRLGSDGKNGDSTGAALRGARREDEPGCAAHDGHGVGLLRGRHGHPYGITRVPAAS